MVSIFIWEFISPVYFMNNDIIDYVVEVNPERRVIISQQSWSDIERQTCKTASGTALYLNQIIVMVKLSIDNKNYNISNIGIFDLMHKYDKLPCLL